MLVCGVLGPTEVSSDGIKADVGGPVPRRLLTALVAAEGAVVTDDRLADAVWGASAPQRPASALQVYVSRLRRVIKQVDRSGQGYRLQVATDASQFAEAVRESARLQPSEALRVLTATLELWRGEPYADLADSPLVMAARERLKELHEHATEELLAARLAVGDTQRAVAELEESVIATPYRERRWELLVLGLYRAGRQGDAFAALRRVRELLADNLGADPGPQLQELEQRILAQDPRLLRKQARPTGGPLSAFLGRDTELGWLDQLRADQRLVTVVGPAGVGKTRLTVEHLARRPGQDWWLVRLADVSRVEVLAQAVADAVGLAQVAGDPQAALTTALAHSAGLLVLDNCEHLVDGVATLAAELLERCPGLSVLATSREPLGVDGEKTVPLDPLPDDAAVELLIDRITAIRPGWTPTPEEHRHARHVCVALDGLPLALELAAARARVLGLGEIAERLDDRFAVLGEVPRGSLTAHATLQAAIAWSVDLLPDADRALLTRLWPFEGGFSLAAAEAVGLTGTSVLESLSALVSRSMIIADTTMTPARYRLLETIRAFCRAADPDQKSTQDAHAQWIRELAAARGAEMLGERSGWATRMLSREWPNLRAGLAHDLTWHPVAALRTVGKLDWFWHRSGHINESRQLLRAALGAAPDASEMDRAAALASLVILTYFAGDLDEARHLSHIANETIIDEAMIGRMRFYTAMGGLITGDSETARAAAVESIAAGQRLGQPWLVVGGQMILGTALALLGDVAEGEASLLDAAELAERCGMPWAVGWANFALAQSYLVRGAPAGAALRLALDRFNQDEDINYVLAVLHGGACMLMVEGNSRDAGRLRAAVRQHAAQLGLWPERLLHFDLSRLEADLPEHQGPPPTWQEMIGLF